MRSLPIKLDALVDAALSARVQLAEEFSVRQAMKAQTEYCVLIAVMTISLGMVCGGTIGLAVFQTSSLLNAALASLVVLGFIGLVGAGVFSDRAYTRCRKWLKAAEKS